MKKIVYFAMGLLCSLGVFTACSDDRDDNPTLQVPTQFVLNAPDWAGSSYDLAQSPTVALTCEQPNYGADITTRYTVEVATKADMSNATAISTVFHTTKLDIDAAEMASALTTQAVEAGKAESDFPLDLPVYVRVKAKPVTAMGSEIDSLNHAYAITSNVVKLSRVHLKFSLPPVAMPEHLYITGNFNGWNWDRALEMVPVNGTNNLFWHMVYIDASGIKFNTARAWNGSEQGFGDITLDAAGELAGTIVNAGGNIASSAPGWYLMIAQAKAVGRKLHYTVTFNRPNVWLMGVTTAAGNWSEQEAAARFSVPTTATGEFVSPAFARSTTANDYLRVYVKVPGMDWWRSEFMVFSGKIEYRGKGGDQPHVSASAGQKLKLNFTAETGTIE